MGRSKPARPLAAERVERAGCRTRKRAALQGRAAVLHCLARH